MIFKVCIYAQRVTRFFTYGNKIPKISISNGLPPGAVFFHAYADTHGNWCLLFEGKPKEGEDVEGAITEICPVYTEHWEAAE